MYDEIERAVTGKSPRGISFLGWVGIVLVLLFMFGTVGAGWAFFRVKSEVEEIAREIRREVEVDRRVAGAVHRAEGEGVRQILSNLGPRLDDLTARPEEGLTLIRNLQAADLSHGSIQEAVEGSLRIRGEEGEITADLQGNQEGGSLVIGTPEGEIRLDLVKQADGGTLTLRGPEGDVRLEVVGDEEGGRLLLHTEDETIRFGSGWAAEELPGWVPHLDGMPEAPRQVYSASSSEGFLGAVAWEGPADPREILRFYRQDLAGEGYEVKAEHALRDAGHAQGSLWARHEGSGRVVFVVAEAEADGPTRILLGYGEERR